MEGLQTNISKPLEIVEVEGKGRGTISCRMMFKGECYAQYFLDEYIDEYDADQEGSCILEAQLPSGKWLCLDATRRMNCFGRYMMCYQSQFS